MARRRKGKPPIKPSGSIGSTFLESQDGSPHLRTVFLEMPTEKREIERFVLDRFQDCQLIYQPEQAISSVVQLSDSSEPDFKATIHNETGFVELTELAPLNGPYASAERVWTVKELADAIMSSIGKKNEIYRERQFTPIYLLIYVSHDAFYITEEVVFSVQFQLSFATGIVFREVWLYIMEHNGAGAIRPVYPAHDVASLEQILLWQDLQIINLDLTKQKLVSADTEVEGIAIRRFLPKGAVIDRLVPSIRAGLIEHGLPVRNNMFLR